MVNIQQPKLPSGGATGVARTAVRDTAGAAYVGLVVLTGLGVAMWARGKISSFVASKASSEAPSQPAALFRMG